MTRSCDSAPSLAVLYPKAVLTGFRRKGGELPDTVYTLAGVQADAASTWPPTTGSASSG